MNTVPVVLDTQGPEGSESMPAPFEVGYLDQLDTKLLGWVLGSVGNLVVFRLSAKDAGTFEREFEPVFSREDILSLPY